MASPRHRGLVYSTRIGPFAVQPVVPGVIERHTKQQSAQPDRQSDSARAAADAQLLHNPPSSQATNITVHVGHAISDRKYYFRLIYALFAPTALFVGPSRLVGKSEFLAWFQWAFMLVCFASGVAYYGFLLPDYEATCCIKPHVTRRDVGSCKDALSIIGREIAGISSIKQECGSSTVTMISVYSAFVLSLLLVLLVHAAQIEEVYRGYKHLISSLKGRIHPQTSPLKILDETADMTLFAVDIVFLHRKARDIALSLYLWPESFLFGWPLIMFHGWPWVILHTVLTLTASVSIAYYFEVIHKLWRAWGCYPPGTDINDLDNGLCTSGWHKEGVKSFVSVFVGCSAFVLKVLVYFLGYITTRNQRTNYHARIHRSRLVSDEDKKVLIEFIEDATIPQTPATAGTPAKSLNASRHFK